MIHVPDAGMVAGATLLGYGLGGPVGAGIAAMVVSLAIACLYGWARDKKARGRR